MRIKVNKIVLKEVENTKHQLDRFKSRFNVLCQGDIDNEDKTNILRNLNTLNQITLGGKSYAVRLGGFKVNKNSKYFIDVNGRGYYRVNDELFKDSTGNEFWAIVRNNKITTFMLRKEIQSRDVNSMIERLRVDDVIFDINQVNTNEAVMQEEVITEDFNSQGELEKLSVDIFKTYLIDMISEKEFILKQFRYPRLWLFNTLITKNEYHTLTDFIQNFRMFFQFENNINGRHAYFAAETLTKGIIGVEYDLKKVLNALQKLDPRDSKEEQLKDLYYTLYDNKTLSGILHELQHVYDHYRSKGKFIDSNKKAVDYYSRVKNGTPKGDEKTNYLKLKHEIEARFTQTINLIDVTDSLREYLNDFTKNFEGWDKMTPKVEKYLLRKASQYYYNKKGK